MQVQCDGCSLAKVDRIVEELGIHQHAWGRGRGEGHVAYRKKRGGCGLLLKMGEFNVYSIGFVR